MRLWSLLIKENKRATEWHIQNNFVILWAAQVWFFLFYYPDFCWDLDLQFLCIQVLSCSALSWLLEQVLTSPDN